MIPLFCVMAPLLTKCPQYVVRVPQIRAIAEHGSAFTGRDVEVFGTVRSLDQWKSTKGPYQYEQFYVCNGGACVHVFMESHSPIRNGQYVEVYGTFYVSYHASGKAYSHEIEATEITPH